MGGAVPPLPHYAFMAWCSVRGSTGTTLTFTLRPTQPPIQWVPRVLSRGIKRPGREADFIFTMYNVYEFFQYY
jgi:hypothetical protein